MRFERTVPSRLRICLGIYLLGKQAWEAEPQREAWMYEGRGMVIVTGTRFDWGRLSRLAVALGLATLLIGCGLPADPDESEPVRPVIVTPEPRPPGAAAPTSEPVDVNALPKPSRRAIASPEPTR